MTDREELLDVDIPKYPLYLMAILLVVASGINLTILWSNLLMGRWHWIFLLNVAVVVYQVWEFPRQIKDFLLPQCRIAYYFGKQVAYMDVARSSRMDRLPPGGYDMGRSMWRL